MLAKKVLIFDSGVGGLSIYQHIAALLPQIDIVYAFDNAAYPYGELEATLLVSRVEAMLELCISKERVDLIVIACNTASTIVLSRLRHLYKIPIVGVVPAIKPAALLAKKGIGFIATPATIKRPYTTDLIAKYALGKKIVSISSTYLVDLAEAKLRGRQEFTQDLQQIFKPLSRDVDVIVLGCTHFPLLKEEIRAIFKDQVHLIDSGQAIAERVKYLLGSEEMGLERSQRHRIFASASPKEEAALNKSLAKLGFQAVEVIPLPLRT